eukprot:gb/GFBE01080215.1/.p1 GENE.gb/GFBE01080215.1/~~gb/GFBE01080215.1/.p1  ORF type:complete len:557 (+),score=144.77 gb/GFBE01080215.1/:1-1671(+)
MAPTCMGLRHALGCIVLMAARALAKEDESPVISAENFGTSVMLLGSIAFMMSIFYLVNHSDADMRNNSWKVVSATISIFSAVLLFQAVNGVVEFYILEGASENFELAVSFIHMMIWFTTLQVFLSWVSGAIGTPPSSEEAFERMELNLLCFAVLLGHITGFAAINAFGVLQQQVHRTPLHALLIVPIAWVFFYCLCRLTRLLRDRVSLSDDGKFDAAEEKWEDMTAETEDDVVGLAVSFVAIQAARFKICGELPNVEGEEREDMVHTKRQMILLLGVGILLTFLNALRRHFIKRSFGRLQSQLRNIVAMCFAWTFYFSSNWWIESDVMPSDHGMLKEVVVAIFVTAFSFTLIFLLDIIQDSEPHATHKHVTRLVQALGILVGFGWEKAFDAAVADMTEQVDVLPPPVTKMILAVVLVAIVVPAWRFFILPTILEFMKIEEEEEEEEKEGAEKDAESGSLAEPFLNTEKAAKRGGKEYVGLNTAVLKSQLQEAKARHRVLEAERDRHAEAGRAHREEAQAHAQAKAIAEKERDAHAEARRQLEQELNDIKKRLDALK